jgi:tetratricopeptide (TPR) repeat protein
MDSRYRVSLPAISGLLCGALASLGTLALVIWTVAPALTFGDSGELLSAVVTNGIAHAPGYPLWVTVTHAWVSAEPLATPAASANLLSAVWLGAAGLFLFIALRELAGHDVGALLLTWVLCLTPVVWEQAVVTEVYTFDLALLAAGLAAALRVRRGLVEGQRVRWYAALGLGLLLGLSFAHRPFNALLQLGLIFLFIDQPRRLWLTATAVPIFVLGYAATQLVWLLIPLRAGAWPEVAEASAYCWAAPTTWPEFRHMVTAGPYRRYMWGAEPPLWGVLLRGVGRAMAAELSLPVWVLAALGAVRGWRQVGARLAPFVWTAVVSLAFFWNYTAMDQEVFFIPTYLGLVGLAAGGLPAVAALFGGEKGKSRGALAIALSVLLAWIIAEAPRTYREVDRSEECLADIYADRVLQSVPEPNADIIMGERHVVGDHRIFPLYYYRHVYGCDEHRVWLSPEYNDVSFRHLQEWLGASEEQIDASFQRPFLDRDDWIATLALRRGRVCSAGALWYRKADAYLETEGWISKVTEDRVDLAAEDPRRYEALVAEAMAWAQWCLRVGRGDRAIEEMAFAPLLELSDERLLYGDAAEALDLVGWGRQLAPDQEWLIMQEARARCALGQPESAASLLRRERRRVSDLSLWTPMTEELGNALYEAGELDGAIEAYERAMAFRVPPVLEEERLRLADCYRKTGEPDKAEAALKPLYDLGLPRDP